MNSFSKKAAVAIADAILANAAVVVALMDLGYVDLVLISIKY